MVEQIGLPLEMGETIILGLRLVLEGVAFDRFFNRFGVDVREIYDAQIVELRNLGLLEVLPDRIRLTPRGRPLGNQAFLHFLPDDQEN
jgi:oxygen-independent coproporphyrinogen-3 oxidase